MASTPLSLIRTPICLFQEALDQASATISENDTVISDQNNRLSVVAEEMEYLKTLLKVREEELQKVRAAQEELQSQLETAHAENALLEEQSRRRLVESEEEIAGIREQLQSTRTELSSTRDQLETLQDSVSLLQQEKANLLEENDSQRSEIERSKELLASCGSEFDAKVTELNDRLSDLQTRWNSTEIVHAEEKQALLDQVASLKSCQDDLKVKHSFEYQYASKYLVQKKEQVS